MKVDYYKLKMHRWALENLLKIKQRCVPTKSIV